MRWTSLRRIARVIRPLWAVPAVAASLAVTDAPLVAQTHGDSVWVNTHSGVYHCPGSHSYGTSKHGQYMAEATAVSRRYRPAKGRSCGAASAAAPRDTTRRAAAPSAHEGQVWVNTRSHVYHCPGTNGYGRSKAGVYMTERAALAAGNRPAKGNRCH